MNATQVLQTRKQRYKNQTNVVPTLIPKLAFPFLTYKKCCIFLKIHLKLIKNLMKIILKTTLWRSLGGSWSQLGRKTAFRTTFWSHLGHFWVTLGATLDSIVATLVTLGAIVVTLGAILVTLGPWASILRALTHAVDEFFYFLFVSVAVRAQLRRPKVAETRARAQLRTTNVAETRARPQLMCQASSESSCFEPELEREHSFFERKWLTLERERCRKKRKWLRR